MSLVGYFRHIVQKWSNYNEFTVVVSNLLIAAKNMIVQNWRFAYSRRDNTGKLLEKIEYW